MPTPEEAKAAVVAAMSANAEGEKQPEVVAEEVAPEKGAGEKEEGELEKSFGGVNIRSSKQMAKLLYEDMGFQKQYHPKKGNLTTGKEALMKLRRKLG